MSAIPKRFGDWVVEIDDDNVPHTVPVADFFDHYFSDCPCRPEHHDGICVHNSFDGREAFETGRRQPS